MRDDELIPWTEEFPPRIDEGEYDAVVRSVKKVDRFGLTTAEFRFRLITLGPAFDLRLPAYCNLGPVKHPGIRPHSKMGSWQRAVVAFTGGSPSRVTLRSFRDFVFRVQVVTVLHKMQGSQRIVLHERDQYSVVIDILGVLGKLSELPLDRQSPDGAVS